VHFSCQEREKKEKTKKIDHRWQSNHYQPTRATLYEREHDCASKKMTNSQI
jgi:hypothetical protein